MKPIGKWLFCNQVDESTDVLTSPVLGRRRPFDNIDAFDRIKINRCTYSLAREADTDSVEESVCYLAPDINARRISVKVGSISIGRDSGKIARRLNIIILKLLLCYYADRARDIGYRKVQSERVRDIRRGRQDVVWLYRLNRYRR